MRVVFFGTPMFSVPTLEAIAQSSHRVVAVVTQPDRPRGRGQHVSASPVKVAAETTAIPVWQPERLKDPAWLAAVHDLHPDIGVVAAYGKILPQVLLDVPPAGFVNVHASLLPAYRGASPIQRAVMNGDHETGITIMRVVLALDAGPMLAVGRHAIGPDDTSEDVERALATMGARLLVQTLDDIERGAVTETPQDERRATYAPRLTKEDGIIDWSASARVIHNRVRGLRPWPQASTTLAGRRLTVLRGRVGAPEGEPRPPAAGDALQAAEASPGTVLTARANQLVVAAGEGTSYALLEVQLEGKRVMRVRDLLAGHAIERGTRLGRA